MIVIIKQTKKETLLSLVSNEILLQEIAEKPSSMHSSERDSVLTSPFLRVHTETQKMLC